MNFRESQKTGRLRLRHLMEHTEAVGEEMDVERQRFDRLREQGPTRAVSAFNLFQTPVEIADQLVEILDRELGGLDGKRILEPSAGLGRLYKAIRRRSPLARVTAVEVNLDCAAELYRASEGDRNLLLKVGDFLEREEINFGEEFDGILMNPPFKMGRDIQHIDRAVQFLKPGGVLVSLCYAGVKQEKRFRNDPEWNWEFLPHRAFHSEGTDAQIAMVKFRKVAE